MNRNPAQEAEFSARAYAREEQIDDATAAMLEPCQCNGEGCGLCSDDIWYAGEEALEQERRDRAFDRAQWLQDH